jgi:hypothetical protein
MVILIVAEGGVVQLSSVQIREGLGGEVSQDILELVELVAGLAVGEGVGRYVMRMDHQGI